MTTPNNTTPDVGYGWMLVTDGTWQEGDECHNNIGWVYTQEKAKTTCCAHRRRITPPAGYKLAELDESLNGECRFCYGIQLWYEQHWFNKVSYYIQKYPNIKAIVIPFSFLKPEQKVETMTTPPQWQRITKDCLPEAGKNIEVCNIVRRDRAYFHADMIGEDTSCLFREKRWTHFRYVEQPPLPEPEDDGIESIYRTSNHMFTQECQDEMRHLTSKRKE